MCEKGEKLNVTHCRTGRENIGINILGKAPFFDR